MNRRIWNRTYGGVGKHLVQARLLPDAAFLPYDAFTRQGNYGERKDIQCQIDFKGEERPQQFLQCRKFPHRFPEEEKIERDDRQRKKRCCDKMSEDQRQNHQEPYKPADGHNQNSSEDHIKSPNSPPLFLTVKVAKAAAWVALNKTERIERKADPEIGVTEDGLHEGKILRNTEGNIFIPAGPEICIPPDGKVIPDHR